MGGGEVGENVGNDDANDAKEEDVAQSFVSFSSEKETKELWRPPLLSLHRRCHVGSGFVSAALYNQINKHKHDSNK